MRTSLNRIVHDAESAVSDAAKWPESEAAQERVKATLAILRKTLKAEAYNTLVIRAILLRMAADLLQAGDMRDAKADGIRAMWVLLGETLIDKNL